MTEHQRNLKGSHNEHFLHWLHVVVARLSIDHLDRLANLYFDPWPSQNYICHASDLTKFRRLTRPSPCYSAVFPLPEIHSILPLHFHLDGLLGLHFSGSTFSFIPSNNFISLFTIGDGLADVSLNAWVLCDYARFVKESRFTTDTTAQYEALYLDYSSFLCTSYFCFSTSNYFSECYWRSCRWSDR